MLFFADAGVPMIFLEWPAMVMALIPVILIEFFVVQRMLKLGSKTAGIGLTVANLASTLVGVPMTWVVLVVCEMGLGFVFSNLFPRYSETMFTSGHPPGPLGKLIFVALQAPWMAPYESQLYWMIPLAAMLLLVPFLGISYGVESWICVRWWRPVDPKAVRRAIWRANLASYAFLFALALAYLIYSCLYPDKVL
jgi:hypothetical protein